MMLLIDGLVVLMLLAGIRLFRLPHSARWGNYLAAFALLCAFCLVLYRYGVIDAGSVVIAVSAGSIAGIAVAKIVSMIQIPAMVAFQHGAGGVAAFLVSFVELTRSGHTLDPAADISGILGLTVGALTFSGSLVASAKLAGKMRQAPHRLPAHNSLSWLVLAGLAVVGTSAFVAADSTAFYLYAAQILLAACFGVLFSIRIGGADMPVLISFLNATAGLAASLCGVVIGSRLLIAFGATVAASGSILTYVMCKAMNRSVVNVFLPSTGPLSGKARPAAASAPPPQVLPQAPSNRLFANAAQILTNARSVVIVPGYGMARARAQQVVADLADKLAAQGKTVRYAVHPVAGRMPGHMNVLLAEAGVDYDMLVEMDAINPAFKETDAVLVVGACDVVNPAAIDVQGTPISGMPILMAHQAANVICCNFDENPGYSGVDNPLYKESRTLMLLGDARATIERLLASMDESRRQTPSVGGSPADNLPRAAEALACARQVVIIPGYGMALAQAQHNVVALASRLAGTGASVAYAIHPVAGRMPGHMNVILAEADVDYDDLVEMDDANPLFANTDVALVVGACDVVNPAAIHSEGTPISGMPILMAHEAGRVVVCNLDTNPGYSGVANPLYDNANTIMLTGDAKATLDRLTASVAERMERNNENAVS